ncbi:unnamed protein product [Paramecium sonneborni]|uniref:Uncharacterized protein n=1 Tax=Paramecium sonneborni TaxID=65129 RepID=A0A8S1KM73_9CILI|nr:unnamed protein product [Paramecium sonneborni]
MELNNVLKQKLYYNKNEYLIDNQDSFLPHDFTFIKEQKVVHNLMKLNILRLQLIKYPKISIYNLNQEQKSNRQSQEKLEIFDLKYCKKYTS